MAEIQNLGTWMHVRRELDGVEMQISGHGL